MCIYKRTQGSEELRDFPVFYFSIISGPPAPYQPQGWGNGYPHWQQGQPDPSEYSLIWIV